MKRFFKKLFSFLILIGICALLYYFCQGWFERQYLKAKGMYYIHKGDQAYAQDNMAKTLEYYNKGLTYFPGHYEAWFNLGNIYAIYEDYYSAINAYKQAIEHHPNFILARMNLGIIYAEDLGFFDEAIEQFDKVTTIKVFPILHIPYIFNNVYSSKWNRGTAFFNKGVAYKQKAIYLPIEKKYLAYQYLGNAIEAYTSALKYLKNNYDVLYNRAVAHHLRGEYKEAGLDYCKAIQITPMKFEAHYNLAVLLRHMKKYRDSIYELEKAAILITESPDASGLQSAYIFNLLNEVSRKFITSNEYGTEKLTDEPIGSISYTYINGRIVADEEFDKAMLKNFKTCAGFKSFIDDDDNENGEENY